jgi:hypothetical protein
VYAGNHYKARRTTVATTTAPNNNLDDWLGISGGGSAQGSADEVASGNDSDNGAPGFKNVLKGTTAPAPAAWSSTAEYAEGTIVKFGASDHHYRAKMAVSSGETSPDVNTTKWEDYEQQFQSDNKLSGRISGHMTSSSATIAARAPPSGTGVASGAIEATTVNAGTFAALNGTIVAGHSVRVRANDDLTIVGLAGAVAGGFVGVGVAVLILTSRARPSADRCEQLHHRRSGRHGLS